MLTHPAKIVAFNFHLILVLGEAIRYELPTIFTSFYWTQPITEAYFISRHFTMSTFAFCWACETSRFFAIFLSLVPMQIKWWTRVVWWSDCAHWTSCFAFATFLLFTFQLAFHCWASRQSSLHRVHIRHCSRHSRRHCERIRPVSRHEIQPLK